MASKNTYLDTNAVVNAADLINSTLIAKGYVETKLKFNTTDWEELVKDQISENDSLKQLHITETIYQNDKNVINIIYSLLQSIERNQVINKNFNKLINTKNSKIEELNQKIAGLESKLEKSEKRISGYLTTDNVQNINKINELMAENRLQNQDLNKLKVWCGTIKTKYQVEMKKKNWEINQLKDKLLEDRSTVVKFPPGSSIVNNIPIIDNGNGIPRTTDLLEPNTVLNSEYEEIAVQLADLIDNLIKENSKFAKFVKTLNNYFSKFNSNLLNQVNLPNPSDEIDLKAITGSTEDEIESFDYISKPLLNNVYKNYHHISGLVASLDSNVVLTDYDAKSTIDKLRSENELLYSNWQTAIKALDDWKSYQANQLEGEAERREGKLR